MRDCGTNWVCYTRCGFRDNELTFPVGSEPDFPFAFMRRAFEPSTPSINTENTTSNAAPRPGSEVFPEGYDIGVTSLDQVLTRESTQPELPPARRPSKLEQRERE